MKAIIISSPGVLEIREKPLPEIQSPTEALLKVHCGGLCGSDLHAYHGKSPFVQYPLLIGHELSAEVVKAGAGTTRIKPGDHVVFDPVNNCGKCLPCLLGRGNVCENLKVNGAHVDGGFAQYIVCEERKLYPVSKDVPWDIAAMAEPFTIGAQAASRGGLRAGDRVLIVGAGPIGQVALQVCKAGGASVYICDLSLARLELALKNGADDTFQAGRVGFREFLDARGLTSFTFAIDAVGAPNILPDILTVMSPAGRVVLLGFNADATPIRQLDITRRELDVVGSRLSVGQFPKVVDWIERGIIHPERIITHRLPFERALDGLLLMQDHPDDCCKVILEF